MPNACLYSFRKYTKLVHFSAEWCGACKQMDEFLIELLNTDDYALYGHSKEFEVVKIDAESMPEISIEYGITAVPSIIAFQVY
jgi:thioredoxin-like negative regulator of GroEL